MSAFEADRFNHSRTSPKNSCWWPVCSTQKIHQATGAQQMLPSFSGDFGKTAAELLLRGRPARRPEFPFDDSAWGDSPLAESNARRLLSDLRRHIPGDAGGHEPALPHTSRRAQL